MRTLIPIKPAGIWKAASFFVPPSRTLDEIATRTGGAYPTVTREVRRLQESGLLDVEEIGRSKRVRLNADSSLYRLLAELMVRAFGSAVVVGEFGSLDGVDEVSIFGSWAARYSGEPGA